MERIAIIGGGTSGLTCALRLKGRAQVTVFEKDDRLGGHVLSYTTPRGSVINPYVCDFTRPWYPQFFGLMEELGFDDFRPLSWDAVIHADGRILHAQPPSGLDGWRANLRTYLDMSAAPSLKHWARFYGFLLRFFIDFKRGRFPADMPVEELERYYPGKTDVLQMSLLPFSAVKTLVTHSVGEMGRMLFGTWDARSLVQRDMFVTPDGALERYIGLLADRSGAEIRLGTPIERVERTASGYRVKPADGPALDFDRVVVAVSPPDVSRFLDLRDDVLTGLFHDFEGMYDPVVVAIHTDDSVMCGIPRRLWGAFDINYVGPRLTTVSMFQPIFSGADEDVWVSYFDPFHLDFTPYTLSRPEDTGWKNLDWASMPVGCRLDPERILDVKFFRHPVFGAPRQLERFNRIAAYAENDDPLYFCGVGLDGKNGYGQEGAVASANRVAGIILRDL